MATAAAAPEGGAAPAVPDVQYSDRDRFELELEFVQCLANAEYVTWLAQNQYFDDPAFLAFLDYLLYWCKPEYSHYIVYPHCLFILKKLKDAEFRKALKRKDCQIAVAWQQDYFFRFFRTNRLREAQAEQSLGKAGEDTSMQV